MTPLALFSGPFAPLARAAVIALIAAAVFAYGWVKGNEHGSAKLADYIGEQAKATVALVTKQGETTTKVVTKYIQVAAKAQVVTQTIEKEVTRYAETNPGNCLDPEWRRLHDSAAAGIVPDASAGTDGPGGTPSAAEAIETVTSNYAGCIRTADRLTSLQEWVREQAAVR